MRGNDRLVSMLRQKGLVSAQPHAQLRCKAKMGLGSKVETTKTIKY